MQSPSQNTIQTSEHIPDESYTEWIQSINQSSYPGNCQLPVGSWHVIFIARSTALNKMQAESSPGQAVHGEHSW